MTKTTHYQVTDYLALCNAHTTTGSTVESNVTCPKCQALLDRINQEATS